ncbi:major histocompatibility complex class I-related gene protein-like isoform X1 [Epinephelus moara]|uniref:major histocompatibility complex class I-related gene protein-like isoform X1 n=1 Tax=Epinephelus moara TaxID=300413 RepID=UPI00214F5D56|nr:major histocompatibility complex class I-related gene protein-like isoform X1 [Epinephelus moara]
MKKSLLFLLFCHVSSPVKHTLKYFITASSGVPNFPEFVGVGVFDEILVGYCDTNIMKVEPKQDWMKKLFENDPQHLEWHNGECFENLHNFFKATIYGLKQRFNQTGEHPSVSLLQKSPSSPVSCHATGFYPDRAMMFWRKDGEEIHEDVDHGEILPNHDGSFQMSVDLNLSSVPPEDWRRYDCVFHLSGVKDDIVTKLDKAVIRTNWGKTSIRVAPSEVPAGPVVGVVVGLLLLTLCITGLFIWRRNNNGFSPANSSDSSSSQTSSVKHAALI